MSDSTQDANKTMGLINPQQENLERVPETKQRAKNIGGQNELGVEETHTDTISTMQSLESVPESHISPAKTAESKFRGTSGEKQKTRTAEKEKIPSGTKESIEEETHEEHRKSGLLVRGILGAADVLAEGFGTIMNLVLPEGEEKEEKIAEGQEKIESKGKELGGDVENLQNKTGQKVEEVQEKAGQQKENLKENVEELKSKVSGKLEQGKQEAERKGGEIKESIGQKGEELKKRGRDWQEETSENIEEGKEKLHSGKEELKRKGEELGERASRNIEQGKEELQSKGQELKENVSRKGEEWKNKGEQLGERASRNIEQGKEQLENKGQELKENINQKGEELKNKGEQFEERASRNIEQGKEELKNKGEQLGEKASRNVEQGKQKFESGKEELKNKGEQLGSESKGLIEQAKETGKNVLGEFENVFKDEKEECADGEEEIDINVEKEVHRINEEIQQLVERRDKLLKSKKAYHPLKKDRKGSKELSPKEQETSGLGIQENIKEAAQKVTEKGKELKEKVGEKFENVKQGAKQTLNQASEKVEGVKQGAKQTLNQTSQKAEDLKQGAKQTFSQASRKISQEGQNFKQKGEQEKENVKRKTSGVSEDVSRKIHELADRFQGEEGQQEGHEHHEHPEHEHHLRVEAPSFKPSKESKMLTKQLIEGGNIEETGKGKRKFSGKGQKELKQEKTQGKEKEKSQLPLKQEQKEPHFESVEEVEQQLEKENKHEEPKTKSAKKNKNKKKANKQKVAFNEPSKIQSKPEEEKENIAQQQGGSQYHLVKSQDQPEFKEGESNLKESQAPAKGLKSSEKKKNKNKKKGKIAHIEQEGEQQDKTYIPKEKRDLFGGKGEVEKREGEFEEEREQTPKVHHGTRSHVERHPRSYQEKIYVPKGQGQQKEQTKENEPLEKEREFEQGKERPLKGSQKPEFERQEEQTFENQPQKEGFQKENLESKEGFKKESQEKERVPLLDKISNKIGEIKEILNPHEESTENLPRQQGESGFSKEEEGNIERQPIVDKISQGYHDLTSKFHEEAEHLKGAGQRMKHQAQESFQHMKEKFTHGKQNVEENIESKKEEIKQPIKQEIETKEHFPSGYLSRLGEKTQEKKEEIAQGGENLKKKVSEGFENLKEKMPNLPGKGSQEKEKANLNEGENIGFSQENVAEKEETHKEKVPLKQKISQEGQHLKEKVSEGFQHLKEKMPNLPGKGSKQKEEENLGGFKEGQDTGFTKENIPEGEFELQREDLPQEERSLKQKVLEGFHQLKEKLPGKGSQQKEENLNEGENIGLDLENVGGNDPAVYKAPTRQAKPDELKDFKEVTEGFSESVEDYKHEKRMKELGTEKVASENPFEVLEKSKTQLSQPLGHDEIVGGNLEDVANLGEIPVESENIEGKSFKEKIHDTRERIGERVSEGMEKIKSVFSKGQESEDITPSQQG